MADGRQWQWQAMEAVETSEGERKESAEKMAMLKKKVNKRRRSTETTQPIPYACLPACLPARLSDVPVACPPSPFPSQPPSAAPVGPSSDGSDGNSQNDFPFPLGSLLRNLCCCFCRRLHSSVRPSVRSSVPCSLPSIRSVGLSVGLRSSSLARPLQDSEL